MPTRRPRKPPRPRVVPGRLLMYWDRGMRDLALNLEPRRTNGNLDWLSGVLGTPAFRAELARRGFDITTLRFSVDTLKEPTP